LDLGGALRRGGLRLLSGHGSSCTLRVRRLIDTRRRRVDLVFGSDCLDALR
jgi:hypothetical protein